MTSLNVIYNGKHKSITLTADSSQFSTTKEFEQFQNFMQYVICESGFNDNFTISVITTPITPPPPPSTRRAPMCRMLMVRALPNSDRHSIPTPTTIPTPIPIPTPITTGCSVARLTQKPTPTPTTLDLTSVATRTRSKRNSYKTPSRTVITYPLENYTIETYGRGYLLIPCKDCDRIGQKYFHDGWWMPSEYAWFFRSKYLDNFINLGAILIT